MKKIFNFFNIVMLASAALFITSCGDDTPIDVTSPTITNVTATTPTDVEVGTIVTLTIKGVPGGSPLNSLKVEEDGAVVSADRLTFDGGAVASGTILLLGDNKNGFTKEVTVKVSGTPGEYDYKFTLTDDNQKTDNVTVTINAIGLATTTSEKVYNALGPYAAGLNLSTGKAVEKGSDPANEWAGAHIKDNGNAVVGNTYPWKKEIINWDGAKMRTVAAGTNFDNITKESEIKALYEAGSDITSLSLAVGKVFTVFRDDTYFLVRVKSVEDDGINTGGSGSNVDYSEFEIKQKG